MTNVWDLVIAACISLLTVSFALGVIENFRKHRGWSKTSSVFTTVILFVMSYAIWMLGAQFSAIVTLIEAFIWVILSAQSFVWPAKASNTPKVLER